MEVQIAHRRLKDTEELRAMRTPPRSLAVLRDAKWRSVSSIEAPRGDGCAARKHGYTIETPDKSKHQGKGMKTQKQHFNAR